MQKPNSEHHSDFNLYVRTFLKSDQFQPQNMDFALLSSLSCLAVSGLKKKNFAALALNAFQQHAEFSQIARVCLVRRIGFSNHLEIVSAAGKHEKDTMQAGYRCFVDPNGSLFDISPDSIRTFSSAKKLVENFKSTNKIPQRSIFRIAQMNLNSGVCIGIFDNRKLQGFLFLNAETDILGQLPNQYLPIISYLSLLAHKQLLGTQADPLYTALWQHDANELQSEILCIKSLLEYFKFAMSNLNINAKNVELFFESFIDYPTLLIHGHLAYILAKYAALTQCQILSIKTKLVDEIIVFECEFKSGHELRFSCPLFRSIAAEAVYLGYKVSHINESALSISTQLDITDRKQKIGYSIEKDAIPEQKISDTECD